MEEVNDNVKGLVSLPPTETSSVVDAIWTGSRECSSVVVQGEEDEIGEEGDVAVAASAGITDTEPATEPDSNPVVLASWTWENLEHSNVKYIKFHFVLI